MTFRVGVTLVTLAVLYGLTALAFWAGGMLRRPLHVGLVLLATLLLGLALLIE